jgi:HlyD family secretion protein
MPRPSHTTIPARRGLSSRRLLAALVLVLALPAAGFALWPRLTWSTTETMPMMHRVAKGEFLHEITDRGNVESANNVEIKCEVKAKNAMGTTILEIVPEGTVAKPGDVLVRLDSSLLETDHTSQMITCSNSEAALIQAQRVLETAEISKKEYMEGTYAQTVESVQSEIFVAKEDRSRADQYLVYSKRLAAKGYITAQQLEADQFAVEKAKNALQIAETKLRVLQDFTREKMLVQLEADVKTAEARLKAAKATHELDMAQLALIENQIEKCVIKAPESGQVVYANIIGWRGTKEVMIDAGEQVRERQVLIRLPDPKKMQVVAKINEAKIAQVGIGMPALIRLDAFPELELHGTVEKVSEFPVPTSWMGSTVKEYETMVRIHESPPGLRPGLTAEVRICVENTADVLQVPVQAIFEHGDKYYCVTGEGGRWFAREVAIGSTNDKTVVIRGGLSEGEEIVLNAVAYREKVALPEIPPERRSAGSVAAGTVVPKKEVDAQLAKKPAKADDPVALAASVFGQYDLDHDGKLRLTDLPEKLRLRLQAADVNKDGFIDRTEWAAVSSRVVAEAVAPPINPPKGATVVETNSH